MEGKSIILQLQDYLIAMAARDDLEKESFTLPLLEYARSALYDFYIRRAVIATRFSQCNCPWDVPKHL